MKVDFSEKANVEALRSNLKTSSDLKAFDTFLLDVKIFDFDNEDHVAKAKKCCQNCCQTVTIHTEIH